MSLTVPLLALLWACGSPAPEAPSGPEAAPSASTATAPSPTSDDVGQALEAAHRWMDAYSERLRFDAAVGTWAVAELRHGPWDALHARVSTQAGDPDHEHRRFIQPGYQLPGEYVHRWSPPAEGRVNPNRVITEALFCAEYGWRPTTDAYTCGPMRDDGGYQSTHALWALAIARDNGCLGQTEGAESCVAELADELDRTQPASPTPTRSLDIDLYAERLLMRCLVDRCGSTEADEVRWLLKQQGSDGSWGVDVPDEDPYHRYHATMMTAWALAEWDAARSESP